MDFEKLWNRISEAKRIGICGHVRPDGDCVGSCLGMYNYILSRFGKEADVYMEEVSPEFLFLNGSDKVIKDYPDAEKYVHTAYQQVFQQGRLSPRSYRDEAKESYSRNLQGCPNRICRIHSLQQ